MDTLVAAAAGLDVHKNTVVACVRLADAGRVRLREIRTFRTVAKSLRELRDWLVGHGVTDVAMESTGVYWKPVFNILEGAAKVCLVNARHAKGVPGRKTDAKDCEWLADLLAHGLLRASFIPPKAIRDLRELTRQRTQLGAQTAQVANRIHKILEDAIKLGSVISDVMGKSGRAIIGALAAGEADPAASAGPRMKKKLPAIREALESPVDDNHRFLLRMLLDEFAMLESFVERLDKRVEEVSAPFAQEIELLETIPGIAKTAAQNIVAETGGDMKVFPTAGNLCSWVGMCPGSNRSAGKTPAARTNPGNRWLKTILVQAAWAASHTKNTHLSAYFRKLSSRRGAGKAVVALGDKLLRIVHAMLRNRTPYRDLGPQHGDAQDRERLEASLVRRLEKLGHKVTLEPAA